MNMIYLGLRSRIQLRHQRHIGQDDNAFRLPMFNVARLCLHQDTKCQGCHRNTLAEQTRMIHYRPQVLSGTRKMLKTPKIKKVNPQVESKENIPYVPSPLVHDIRERPLERKHSTKK